MLVRARVPALFVTDVIVVQFHVLALVHALALRSIVGEGTMLRDTRTHTVQGAISVVAVFPRETPTVPHVHVRGPHSEGVTASRRGDDRQATSVAARDTAAEGAVGLEVTRFVQAGRVRLLLHVLARALALDLRLILHTRDTPEADPDPGHSVEAGGATVGMISGIADPGHQYSDSVMSMTSSYSTLEMKKLPVFVAEKSYQSLEMEESSARNGMCSSFRMTLAIQSSSVSCAKPGPPARLKTTGSRTNPWSAPARINVNHMRK